MQQSEEYQILAAESILKYLALGPTHHALLQIYKLTIKILSIWVQSVLDAWYQVLD